MTQPTKKILPVMLSISVGLSSDLNPLQDSRRHVLKLRIPVATYSSQTDIKPQVHGDWITAREGMGQEGLARKQKNILLGLGAAFAPHQHSVRKLTSVLLGITQSSPELIAYVTVQARFALSSRSSWTRSDSKFKFDQFYLNNLNTLPTSGRNQSNRECFHDIPTTAEAPANDSGLTSLFTESSAPEDDDSEDNDSEDNDSEDRGRRQREQHSEDDDSEDDTARTTTARTTTARTTTARTMTARTTTARTTQRGR
ncbi:hypothetical protein F5880DRAFT_1501698 [Lentinula raphanica]|nr:hypothetical protein F5880DRAFT_1501698 [Lentinula raphanica]